MPDVLTLGVAGVLLFAFGLAFYVADNWRELFYEPPCDDPYLDRLCKEIEAASKLNAGGDSGTADGLGTQINTGEVRTHRDGGVTI